METAVNLLKAELLVPYPLLSLKPGHLQTTSIALQLQLLHLTAELQQMR